MSDGLVEKKLSNEVISLLNKKPDGVERFDFSAEGHGPVDMMTFLDRPYKGANCIISNGASKLIDGYKNEFVLIFEESSL